MKRKKQKDESIWLKVYIFLVLAVSLAFIGYNLLAQVEGTPLVLREYAKGTDCPKFMDDNEITIKDSCTGLVWARHELPTYKTAGDPNPGYNWQEAKSACEALSPAGLFRLPTVEELFSLIKVQCDQTRCQVSADIAKDSQGNLPFFSNGYYWTISDFNEPASWTDTNAIPPGKAARNYKRTVNLLTGEVDTPVFGQEMKLNAWCVVNHTPEVEEKKFISATTGAITNGNQVTGGKLKTYYHRLCTIDSDCAVLAGTTCEAANCLGPDPANATLCLGDNLGLTGSVYKSAVDSCTFTNKCEYICNSGYYMSGNSCLPYICTGDDFNNATICTDDNKGLAADTQKTLAANCTNTNKCEFTCNAGYYLSNGSCTLITCAGTVPEHSEICPAPNATNMAPDTPITLVDTCGNNPASCDYICSSGYVRSGTDCVQVTYTCDSQPLNSLLCPAGANNTTAQLAFVCDGTTKCQYTCSSGYTLSGNACVPISYSCSGAVPANATLCSGDDTGLTATATNHAVASCTTAKCEYTCNSGFVLSGTTCVEARYVFVTNGTWNGILGGLSGADAKCQTEATNAGLTGTYKAWLSDSTTSAASRLEHFTGQYKLVDGSVVANSWTDFTDGTLAHAINKTAANGIITSGNVWTGSNANGTTSTMRNNCDSWTDNSGGPEGTTTAIGTTMTVNDNTECYTSYRLYCLQQSQTQPTATNKIVFVTHDDWEGDLGGLSGADSKCQTEATNTGLTGTYKAWLSDSSTSATSRLEHFAGQLMLADGITKVADGWDDFIDGSLDHSINLTAAKASVSSGTIWTGSNVNGTIGSKNCKNWTDTSGGPEGTTTAIGTTMTVNNNTECYDSYRLYCLQQ